MHNSTAHEIFLLINVKMPTIVGILTFMSAKKINNIIGLFEPIKKPNSWYFYTCEQLKFHELIIKKFYNLGPRSFSAETSLERYLHIPWIRNDIDVLPYVISIFCITVNHVYRKKNICYRRPNAPKGWSSHWRRGWTPGPSQETKTKVVRPRLNAFRFSKDDATGHGEGNKTNMKTEEEEERQYGRMNSNGLCRLN